MFNIALLIAIVSYASFLTIYGLYVILVLRNSKTRQYVQLVNKTLMKPLDNPNLPSVSILIPTHNEQDVISKKLQNIAELKYPLEKIEVLLLDDGSTDKTCEIALNAFKRLGLYGRIIESPHRMGVNATFNKGVLNASNDLILRTDADVMIEADALEKAIQVISHIENVGGVTGTMAPISDNVTSATTVENSYRTLFDKMSTAESALHSTFLGGGGFALLKKTTLSPISVNLGSTDGNILLSIIKKGFRYLYVPQTFSEETVCYQLKGQLRQKVRRASRLIQSILMNRDILFKGGLQEFGTLIFPLRFAMLAICPFLMFAGLFSTLFLFLSYSVVLAVSLIFAICIFLYLGFRMSRGPLTFVSSLFIHQFYLLLGLIFLSKKRTTWERTERDQPFK